jgi:hypothetical protein
MKSSDINIFTPYNYNGLIKQRIGSDNDGGYVISKDIQNYDIILSGGAGNNISFEEELTQNLNIQCFIYDHTVKINNIRNKNIVHIPKKLDKKTKCFYNFIDLYHNIFLKLDIECGEYEILEQLNNNQIKKFKQIVIEIHDYSLKQRIELVKRLFQFHTLIHVHANNCCGTINILNINMPKIIELTLVRTSDIQQELISNNKNLPSEYDQPNLKTKPEIILDYFPFVV